MSGLLLSATSADRALTVQADPVTAKLLPGSATSRRTFTSADVLGLYAEIYENAGGGSPRRIDVATKLINEAGQDVAVAREVLERGASTGNEKSATFPLSRQLPLKGVAPGRYLLRVEAQLRGETSDESSVARETSFTVRTE
jgi:hypothetical protein